MNQQQEKQNYRLRMESRGLNLIFNLDSAVVKTQNVLSLRWDILTNQMCHHK